jgi:hypothetical protein
MLSGSCLCGRVQYQLNGEPTFLNHCHCTMCRKASGAAFGSFLHADGRKFKWTSGEDQIATYNSSPGNYRPFCKICGSRVPTLEDDGEHVIIPAGTLNQDPMVRPIVHFHVETKAPWYDIADSIEQCAKFPSDEFWARHGIE